MEERLKFEFERSCAKYLINDFQCMERFDRMQVLDAELRISKHLLGQYDVLTFATSASIVGFLFGFLANDRLLQNLFICILLFDYDTNII